MLKQAWQESILIWLSNVVLSKHINRFEEKIPVAGFRMHIQAHNKNDAYKIMFEVYKRCILRAFKAAISVSTGSYNISCEPQSNLNVSHVGMYL